MPIRIAMHRPKAFCSAWISQKHAISVSFHVQLPQAETGSFVLRSRVCSETAKLAYICGKFLVGGLDDKANKLLMLYKTF